MSDETKAVAGAPGWLAPAAAGRELGVTSGRVRQLVEAGQLAAIRTPLGRLIDAKSVEALQRERQTRKGGRGG